MNNFWNQTRYVTGWFKAYSRVNRKMGKVIASEEPKKKIFIKKVIVRKKQIDLAIETRRQKK